MTNKGCEECRDQKMMVDLWEKKWPCNKQCLKAIALLEQEVGYYRTAALCNEPRGSCRNCKKLPAECYFKDKEQKS